MIPELGELDEKEVLILKEAVGDDPEVLVFFHHYLQEGLSATKAYKKMRPHVTEASAAVMGSRMLQKIDINTVLAVFGLDLARYIEVLKDGLEAETRKPVISKGEIIDWYTEKDHSVRNTYHSKLGRMIGVEKAGDGGPSVAVQVNNIQAAKDKANNFVEE